MQEQARVTFYKLKACGYYKRGERSAAKFGDVEGILKDLQMWGKDKQLSLTKTHEAKENAHLPAYLVDVRRGQKDWLLTLWNEIESTDGAVASIDGFAPVGKADVTMNEFEAGAIPGFASYFWIMPAEGLIASVRFQHTRGGHYQMDRYMHGFLAMFSSHVVMADEVNAEGENVIIGYRATPASDITRFRPWFRSELLRKAGPIDYLLARSDRIRKISKKASLALSEKPKRALWEKMLDQVHVTKPVVAPHEVKVCYEVEVDGLSPDELQDIVGAWEGENHEDNNYGFDLRGETQTHWLDHSFVKDTVDVDVTRKNGEIVVPDSLLQALAVHRKHFLNLTE